MLIYVFAQVCVIVAAAAWIAALYAGLSIVSLAPEGEKLRSFFDLGWWRFSVLEARIGPSVRVHLMRYRYAFMAFYGSIAALVAGVILTLLGSIA